MYTEINAIREQAGEPIKTTQKKKELRKQVDDLIQKIDQPLEKQHVRRGKRRPLRIGDRVYIRRLDTDGVVASFTDDEVEVEIGKMRMKVDIRDVERPKVLERAESVSGSIEKQPGPAKVIYYPSPGAELNLIGKRVDDALMALDRYLDSAQAAGLPYVRIVHGKGTGALRQAVREALGDTPSVERWELALDNEGGEGVTIAFLAGN